MTATKRKPTRRFVFRCELDAENADHARLTLAAYLVSTAGELSADETGEVGQVYGVTMKPQRERKP